MKKILAGILIAASAMAHAAPWDLEISQYDQFGTGRIPRLLTLPGSSAAGILIYNPSTNLPQLATVDSSLNISSGGVLSVNASGFATTAQLATKYDIPVGTVAQYLRGDGTLATFPSIPAAQIQADWSQASSGALDFIKNKPTLPSGTVTSITAGTGLNGGVITNTGTISMPNTGTAGTYSGVTTDAHGRVTDGTTMSINDAPGRTLVSSTSATGFQVSSTRNAYVCYEGVIQTTSTIGGPASGTVSIETANTNSTTPGDWTTIAQQTASNNITLAVVLNQVDGEPWSMCRMVAAGKYVRIRTSFTGTVTFSINSTQQEALL